jgi:hypothetical protein
MWGKPSCGFGFLLLGVRDMGMLTTQKCEAMIADRCDQRKRDSSHAHRGFARHAGGGIPRFAANKEQRQKPWTCAQGLTSVCIPIYFSSSPACS